MLKDAKYTVPLPQLRNEPSIPISSNVIDFNHRPKESKNLEIAERKVEDGSTRWGGNNKHTFVDSSFTLVSPKPQRRHVKSKIALAMDEDEKTTSETMPLSAWKSHETELEQFWSGQSGCKENAFINAPLEINNENEKTLLELLKEGVADISKEIMKDKSVEQPLVLFKIHKIGCCNENKSFANLRQIYPNKSLSGLWDLFVKCKGDLDWVVDILLKEDELLITGVYSSQHDQVEETTFNCTCDNKFIYTQDNNLKSPQNSELNFKRSKPQRTGRTRSLNQMQNQLSAIALKEAIENCIGFSDERHSKHVKEMQNVQKEIQNFDTVKMYVDAEAQTELSDIDDEENQEISGSEFLEISLGSQLVKQLCDIFCSETVNHAGFSDNLITNVFIPKSLARELFMLWMESAYNQIEENRQNSLRDDENFARLLKNPKYEDVKESPDNIKEILDMELALTMYKDDRKKPEQLQFKQQSSDIATSLTQMKLCELFPNIPREALVDIFEAQGNKFNETVSIVKENIESNTMDPNFSEQGLKNENRINNQVVSEQQQHFTDFPPSNISNNYVGPFKLQFQTEAAKRLTLHDFEEARNFAAHHSQLKAECFLKAKEAIQKGNNYVAVYYSQIANLHKKKIDMYNHRAANCIVEVHKYTQKNPDLLDLHYLHVLEAIGCLDLFLDRHITNLRSLSRAYKYVFIITGRGLHSAGGVSTIKNKVKSRLKERSLRWSEVNPGLLKVKVFSASRHSKTM